MILLALLLAAAYGLDDLGGIPPPDAARQARIEKALATIRAGEDAGLDAAVRDLALCGEAALPAIVARLNEAEAGERLLLLAAARPMPRAAPLLGQARADPHPAVRAWAEVPPREREPAVRDLAQEYLDLLAVAERNAYDKANEDLKPLADPLVDRPATLETRRKWMQDKGIQETVREARRRAATRFALAGSQAFARGEMKPDLADAVFVAYVGLLREEEGNAAHDAACALVAQGEAAAAALEPLLDRKNHEPRTIARILASTRADGGRGLYAAFDRRPADAQRALLDLAPDVLERGELVPLLERAALSPDGSVQTAALNGLLELPAPAGREPARALLDPQRVGHAHFRQAAELLARCGDLGPLETFATLPPVPEGPTGDSPQLSSLRAATQTALRSASGEAVEAMGRRLLGAESKGTRTLGIDLVRDREVLLSHAAQDIEPSLARTAILRVLALHPDAAQAALDLLRTRDLRADAPVVQLLVAAGRIDLVVGLAASEDAALVALGNMERIDPKFEGQLLAIYDLAPKERTLTAILPLGTEEVRRRLEAAPAVALIVLRQRAESDCPIPFPFPLRRFLEGADGPRLRQLGVIAEGVQVEPGFFFELYRAWEGVEGSGTGEGVTAERARLLVSLSRTSDAASAKMLFEMLLAGGIKEPQLAMGTLMCAAKLLDAQDLARLLPLLREQVNEERPRNGTESPPYSELRSVLLRGGFNALGYKEAEAALDDLCDVVLDPTLQRKAFDWRKGSESWAPYWALDALRDFSAAAVEPAFRRALARAEADGRLAACDPKDLHYLVDLCRGGLGDDWWRRGRGLYEVGLALSEAVERMPGSDDATWERMFALAALGRYAEAAGAARAEAARLRATGVPAIDGPETPERVEGRARLYDARASGDAKAIFAATEAAHDPFLSLLAARWLRFEVKDLPLAARTAEATVRGTGALWRPALDTLASVRNKEGRPDEALRLLDPRVPTKRPRSGQWHAAISAEALLATGKEMDGRRALEVAADDRRVLPFLRPDPQFARVADVFREADELFFYNVIFASDSRE